MHDCSILWLLPLLNEIAVCLFISLVTEIRSRRKVSLLFRIKCHVKYSASAQQTSVGGCCQQRAHAVQVGSSSYGHASLTACYSTRSLGTLVFFDTCFALSLWSFNPVVLRVWSVLKSLASASPARGDLNIFSGLPLYLLNASLWGPYTSWMPASGVMSCMVRKLVFFQRAPHGVPSLAFLCQCFTCEVSL